MSALQKELEPLEFCGSMNVHGLYDFLLKWHEPRSDKRASSLPYLYSSKPFLNASLKSAQVLKSMQIKQASGECGYKLVIKGYLIINS
jgi:hypothetical protein